MPYYMLNPLTQFIIVYRDVMVAGELPSAFSVGIIVGFTIAAYLVGSLTFSKLQRRFAEEI
jgi:ABC-type polysaccharide/polyol phosphate export permease